MDLFFGQLFLFLCCFGLVSAACIDLFLASILTALATLLVWTASFPELAVAPALMAAGLYVLHWLLLTAALFLFLFGICVILGVLRRMRCS